jgi:hypothetical protein
MKQAANIANLLREGQELYKFGGIYLCTNEHVICMTSLYYFYFKISGDITVD